MNQTQVRSTLYAAAKGNLTAFEEAKRNQRNAKRKKKKWKDRVAPTPVDEPKENAITDDILTLCTRCPAHRNREGRFRPLIGNGEYVCDGCYQREFPATAMLDDVDQTKVQRMGKRMSNAVKNKVTDMATDIMGNAQDTPDGAIQRAKKDRDDRDEYPSEVECRMCLERGIFRRCCDVYYCHSCYFNSVGRKCPGCGIKVHLTGIADLKPDPGKLAVGLSWALNVLLVLITTVVLALVSYNASTTPTTVWGRSCRGWYEVCDLSVCIDADDGTNDGYGVVGSYLPPAQPYRVCDRSTSTAQVVGSACVYDRELYTWSNNLIGYDLCVSSTREEQSRQRNVSSVNPLLLYSNGQEGIYVFDDDFELPFADGTDPWTEIINGDQSDACGVNIQSPERGKHGGYAPVESKKALVFTGVRTRHAITNGLDVKHGGRVEFFLKMGPITSDALHLECKAAFSDVTLEYRTPSAGEWKVFGTYPAWKYRGKIFQFVSQDIPIEAYGNSTRFKFRQASFDVLRDHWAIDDVRILAKLKPAWQDSMEFRSRKERQNEDVLFAQCCWETDQCNVFDKKRIKFDPEFCDIIPGFGSSQSRSRLKLTELMILYLFLAAGAKALYNMAVWRFRRRVVTMKQDTNIGDNKDMDEEAAFPCKSYYAIAQLSWQYTSALVLILVLVGTLYRLLDALLVFQCLSNDAGANKLACKTDPTFVMACTIALAFDLRAIGIMLTQVFCVQNPRRCKPVQVEVDLHPERSFLRVGSKTVPLSEVCEIKSQSSSFYSFVSFCYILGGLPFALGSLTLQSYHLTIEFEVFTPILGCVAILREVFGISLFTKLYLTIGWVITKKQRDRDELGRAVLRKGLLQQFIVGSTLAPVLMFSLLGRRVDNVSTGDNFILFLLYAFCGGLAGLLLGIMHGVPVIPHAKLTCWPQKCFSVSYYDRVDCPCLFSCTYCSEVHSRQVLEILPLAQDDIFALKRILQGDNTSVDKS